MNATSRSTVLALLVVLGLGLGAASFDSTMTGGDSGEAVPGEGEGQPRAGGSPDSAVDPAERQPMDIPYVEAAVTATAALVLLVLAALALRYRDDTVKLAGLATVALAVGAVSLLLLPGGSGSPTSPINYQRGGAGAGEQAATQPDPVLSVVAAGVGLVLVGAVVAVVARDRTTDDVAVDAEAATADSSDAEAVGRAAGRAAERLTAGEGTTGNEIVRAWREMTDLLDVDRPESSTPGEFADAAVEAGLDEADVAELTRLFEEVRYGDYDTTSADEERAVSLFRRIEASYARTGTGASGGGASDGDGKSGMTVAESDENSDDPTGSGRGDT